MPCTHLKLYQYKSNKGAYKKMCSGQNSLGKGGLNAKAGFCYPYNNRYISFLPSDDTEIFISRNVKAKRREFIECDIRKSPFSKPCVMDTDSVNKRILKDLEDYIARCKECDFLPLIPDGTMYEIKQYAEYVDLNIVLTRKD